ncbi:bifunctional metallophosphatase/5'-nucleotidase [Auraticoccus monumenti]|uniref:5'-nucleotidase n=1 Tax=Auraticoccus monumenti TaxID=675864 RepID=A0A1G6YF87_9ACTN|nr:5'-nucleotidase C-terminal domain-containing protein [Auraticoccus monumenti]SDD88387.1 5'-nucleotidase [Auraticoccus monumenti]
MTTRRWRVGAVTGAALALSVCTLPWAASPAHADERDITVLSFSDYHGRITPDLTIPFAGQIEQLREANGEDSTLLLSGGDNIGATLFPSAVDDDDPTIDILNALEVSASAVGNHEFDQGFDDLTGDVIAGEEVGENPNGDRPAAGWDYLGANVYEAGTDTPALPEYGIYTVDGIVIGVIGVVTEQTPTLVSPDGVADIDFGDPVEAVNRVAGELTDDDDANGEADVLVAVYHEGYGSEGDTLEDAVASSPVFDRIVNDTDDAVSAIITGHSHQAYAYQDTDAALEGGRPIIQAGEYASGIGEITITVEDEADGGPEAVAAEARIVAPIPVEDENEDDSTDDELEALTADLVAEYPRIDEIDEIITAALAYADEAGSVLLAEAESPITTAFTDGSYGEEGYGDYDGTPADPLDFTAGDDFAASRDDRGSESALGNLVADALLTSLADPDRGGAEIAVTNPGGLRSDFAPGDITVADANAVLPFLNNLNTVTLTGEQLFTMLEQQWQTAEEGEEEPSRDYLQLGLSANMSYTFDPDAAQGEHITQVFVDGVPIDPDGEYRVGTFSFLAQGGDNFRVFRDGTDLRDSGLVDRDAWFDYLAAFGEEGIPLNADYSKRSAVYTGDAPLEATGGETVELTVSGLDQTSIGAPQVETVAVGVLPEDGGDLADLLEADRDEATFEAALQAPDEGIFLGEFEVVDGSVEIEAELPQDLSGTNQLFLATDTGSLVGITLEVAAAAEPEPTPTPEPSPEPTEEPEPTTEPTPDPEPTTEPTPDEVTPSAAPIGTGDGTDVGDLADTGSSVGTTWVLALGAVLLVAGTSLLAARGLRSGRR